jgi:hypothetical protein
MSYQGTTAASTNTNPPMAMWAPALGGVNRNTTEAYKGRRVWLYNSTHSTTQMSESTGFFTDAFYIGMKQGDIVIGTQNTGSSVGVFMGVIGAVTTAGGSLASTGGILSSTR